MAPKAEVKPETAERGAKADGKKQALGHRACVDS